MEEREKKAGEKYLRARFFSVWIQRSRHFAGCWIWHSFQKMSAPFQVTEQFLGALRMAESAAGGTQTHPGGVCALSLTPPQREGGIPAFIYLISSQHSLGEELVHILRASRMNLFTFWRWKAAKCCDISQEGWCKKQSLYEEQGGNTYMET